MYLEEAVLRGDAEGAIEHVRDLLVDAKTGPGRVAFRVSYVTAKHFWWLLGKWEQTMGYLGWSPGDREWGDDTVYPRSIKGARNQLLGFVSELCRMSPTPTVPHLLKATKMEGGCAEVGSLRFLLGTYHRVGSAVHRGLYGYIIDHQSLYETMAARPALRLGGTKTGWDVGASALLLIANRGLSRLEVEACLVKERYIGRDAHSAFISPFYEVERSDCGLVRACI